MVQRPDGTEYRAHAKFARDPQGAIIAEGGEQGLAAEFLASRLAVSIGASVPEVEIVDVPEEVDIRLRDDRRPSKQLPAAASRTMDGWTDVNAADAVDDVPAGELAAISALYSWIEAQDRNHNMIRSGGRAYAIDHATAFSSAWAATEPSGALVTDSLTAPRLAANPETMTAAAETLAKVPDDAIDLAVDQLPHELVASADVRSRLKANLKKNRDAVVAAMRKTYGSS